MSDVDTNSRPSEVQSLESSKTAGEDLREAAAQQIPDSSSVKAACKSMLSEHMNVNGSGILTRQEQKAVDAGVDPMDIKQLEIEIQDKEDGKTDTVMKFFAQQDKDATALNETNKRMVTAVEKYLIEGEFGILGACLDVLDRNPKAADIKQAVTNNFKKLSIDTKFTPDGLEVQFRNDDPLLPMRQIIKVSKLDPLAVDAKTPVHNYQFKYELEK